MGCWCPVGTVKHRPRRQPRPAATAAPVPTVSARPRRRRVKVFSQVFFKKLARCGAELHGLNRRSRWKKSSGRGARRWCPVGTVQRRPSRQARTQAIAPGAGAVAPSPPLPQAKPRALCHPKRGTSVPPFWSRGRQGRWCPVGTVQRRPSRQARPTPLATPRPWDSVPHPATFEKVDETFTRLYPAFAEGPALAEGEKAA